MVVPLVFYLGEGCLAAEIGAKLLSLLMGICFLDAARFSTVLVFLSLIEVMFINKFANRDKLALAQAIDRRCRWIFMRNVQATGSMSIRAMAKRKSATAKPSEPMRTRR